MSHDEMQRTMQFLLNQDAKLSADLDRLSEKTNRIADAMIGLTGIVGRLATSQDELRDIIKFHLREDHGYPPPEGR